MCTTSNPSHGVSVTVQEIIHSRDTRAALITRRAPLKSLLKHDIAMLNEQLLLVQERKAHPELRLADSKKICGVRETLSRILLGPGDQLSEPDLRYFLLYTELIALARASLALQSIFNGLKKRCLASLKTDPEGAEAMMAAMRRLTRHLDSRLRRREKLESGW